MNEPVLKDNPTLQDLQDYVQKVAVVRGFDKDSVPQRFMLLTEEVGEFAKSARTIGGLKMAHDSSHQNMEHEAADVLWMLLTICNALNIDLEEALRLKDEHNKKRTWH
jgi:NTP pyrophosphatase (non-canonical NTP hydrolase)